MGRPEFTLFSKLKTKPSFRVVKKGSIGSFSLALLLLCLLTFILLTAPFISNGQSPRVIGLQFDAIIKVSAPVTEAPTLLFVRCWVGSDYYEVAVKWAEPHGSWFAAYPPTLTVRSDAESFTVAHGLFPERGAVFPKPLDAMRAFTNMYGDYPIGNTRDAETEALAFRLGKDQLRHALPLDWTDQGAVLVALSPEKHGPSNQLAFAEISGSKNRIDSLELFAGDGRSVKQVDYEYDSAINIRSLKTENVYLPEKPAKLAMPKGSVTVKTGPANFQFNSFAGTEHQNGRRCRVEYQDVALEGTELRLPVQIEVRQQEGEKVLRFARLTNYQSITLTADAVRAAAAEFAGFTVPERRYRLLLVKYWEKDPRAISDEDRAEIQHLRDDFSGEAMGKSAGDWLKRLNILMELSRMMGDQPGLKRPYEQYLSALADEGMGDFVPWGGARAVDMSVRWGRYGEADDLLSALLSAVVKSTSMKAALEFASSEIKDGNFYSAVAVLDKFVDNPTGDPASRFEQAGLKCLLLAKLKETLSKMDNLKEGPIRKKAEWTLSHWNPGQMDDELHRSLFSASTNWAGITAASDSQKALKTAVDKIAQALVPPP
ncbi:MAG: hypothetical protein ABSG78_16850 [Verrucomicrobiota bacterium]|jgi:hypothetical protein